MFRVLSRWFLSRWITGYYGPRCEDFCGGCAACEAWRCFDMLFAIQPFFGYLDEGKISDAISDMDQLACRNPRQAIKLQRAIHYLRILKARHAGDGDDTGVIFDE
jgi:hypothetical protein